MKTIKTFEEFINENQDYAFEMELGRLLMPWSKYKTYILDKSFAKSLGIKTNKT